MKATKKILFTDLDGTLLDSQKNISAKNQKAVQAALDAGHKIVVATGRPLVSAIAQSKALGLTYDGCYAIAYNGACIYDFQEQKIIYSKSFPRKFLRTVFDQAYKAHLHVQTYSDESILSEYETESLKRYASITKVPYQIVKDVTQALDSDPHKIIVIDYENHQTLEEFQVQIAPYIEGKLQSFFSDDCYLEFTALNLSKGIAIRHLCDYLQIPIENTVAVGDAQNDIPMLEAAAVGAVMANAGDDIKKHGNYITKADNDHSGVAEVIEKFIL